MNTEHVVAAIESLRKKQYIFHSEADFQFSFAWTLQELLPNARIRLEYCPPFAREMHVDIYVIDDDGSHPIELKYKSKTIETVIDNEYFKLKNHGAQDIGRYDYLHDIARIERTKTRDKNYHCGYAIMLTNDPSYWKVPLTSNTVDAAFRTHDGRIVNGSLAWAENVSPGTSKGRTDVISIEGEYLLHWDEYSRIQDAKNGLFQICVVAIK